MHCAATWPVVLPKKPWVQLLHDVAASWLEYVPTGQGWHALQLFPAGAYCPARQSTWPDDVDPGGQTKPGEITGHQHGQDTTASLAKGPLQP